MAENLHPLLQQDEVHLQWCARKGHASLTKLGCPAAVAALLPSLAGALHLYLQLLVTTGHGGACAFFSLQAAASARKFTGCCGGRSGMWNGAQVKTMVSVHKKLATANLSGAAKAYICWVYGICVPSQR